ncbi:MAG TPA: alpha/beta hydrolase [Anaerolineae bacterium]|nr:alpha/beta hydrolase [Anaerolineae bacterium]
MGLIHTTPLILACTFGPEPGLYDSLLSPFGQRCWRPGPASLFLSLCADQAVADYLVEGTLPAEDTVCQQDWIPFGGSPAARPSRARLRAASASRRPWRRKRFAILSGKTSD